MTYKKVHLHDEKDNVAVALEEMNSGDKIKVKTEKGEIEVPIGKEISFGHKIALEDIGKDQEVVKYGVVIGLAKENIKAGDHVHVHNLKSQKYT